MPQRSLNQELNDWQLYGPRNTKFFELVEELAQSHGMRVAVIEQIIKKALYLEIKKGDRMK